MSTEFFFYHHAAKDRMDNQCKDCVRARRRKRYRPIIYKITNTINGKVYIGQTIKPITERVSKHFSDAKIGRKQPLYVDIRELDFNRELFSFSVIECTSEDNLDDRERFWISYYQEAGVVLHNVELGGQKDMVVPRSTRLKQAQTRGTRPFVVYDRHKTLIGEFNIISEAEKMLGTTGLNEVLSGKTYHSKGYMAFYKEEFSEDGLNFNIDKFYNPNKPNMKLRNNENYKGKKNGMYGKRGSLNPNSKKVYVVKDNKVVAMFDSCVEAEEFYKTSNIRNYARGTCNNYFKKLDLYFYYKELLPRSNNQK